MHFPLLFCPENNAIKPINKRTTQGKPGGRNGARFKFALPTLGGVFPAVGPFVFFLGYRRHPVPAVAGPDFRRTLGLLFSVPAAGLPPPQAGKFSLSFGRHCGPRACLVSPSGRARGAKKAPLRGLLSVPLDTIRNNSRTYPEVINKFSTFFQFVERRHRRHPRPVALGFLGYRRHPVPAVAGPDFRRTLGFFVLFRPTPAAAE